MDRRRCASKSASSATRCGCSPHSEDTVFTRTNSPFTFELGAKVKDSITGFAGTITGRCEYITGCAQYIVQPALNKDGAFVEGRWLDEDRLELLPEPKQQVDIRRAGHD